MGHKVAALIGVVVRHGGPCCPAQDADRVACEDGLTEALMPWGAVGVAVGAAVPVALGAAGGALPGAVVDRRATRG